MDTASNRPNRPNTPPPAASDTTRDQRLQAHTLHDFGLTYTLIHEQLGLTLRQIQYAISHQISPKKRSGRPSRVTQEEINELIAWICISKANRRTP
jgi:hypothetical protein